MPATARFAIETLGAPTYPSPLDAEGTFTFVGDDEHLRVDPRHHAESSTVVPTPGLKGAPPLAHATTETFELAGPRQKLFFNPPRARAAIVTCGGLCPGINAVIRALVLQLYHRYNCRDVLGIRYGYGGLGEGAEPPIKLTPDLVESSHEGGGTLLGTSRGTPPAPIVVDALERHGIDILFTIGGDGTMRGATAIWQEIKRRGRSIAVVSVPKTIDNDIPYVRRTFGFETAVSVATQAIHAAHIEATGVPYGIGLVKLMGRNAGYIAATACLATGHANFCLVPEVPFKLDGDGGLLALVEHRVALRRHAVIVVAEGAGQTYFQGEATARDASGNVRLKDIGMLLKERLNAHFDAIAKPVTLKYIDPSYIVRTAPANPADQLHCARFAQNAVHAAMAGKSGLLIGYWHGHMTHVPTAALEGRTQAINPRGELWRNVLETTGQPARIG